MKIRRKLRFITISELIYYTNEWIKSFPKNYDLIVGIPRSGLLVANIIATRLAKPLTVPELFVQEHFWFSKSISRPPSFQNILLVDDSITSGKAMRRSLQVMHQRTNNMDITTAALLATKRSKNMVDLYCKILPHPRVFEWNLLHAKKGRVACDMDGVICENCPPGVDMCEKLYMEWLKNAKPYLIPSFTIDAIITNRLEKYRAETETWLDKNNVRYKKLIMWDIPDKKDRKGRYASHKIEALSAIKPYYFWESSLKEARIIRDATGIHTLCTDEMKLMS